MRDSIVGFVLVNLAFWATAALVGFWLGIVYTAAVWMAGLLGG